MMCRLAAFVLFLGPCLWAQEAIPAIPWSSSHFVFPPAETPALIEVPAQESGGFQFPYYLYIPKEVSRTGPVRLLVEPNNTGQTTDDFEVHRQSARRLASGGSSRRLADRLHTPFLVPVFPRPRSQWKIYTHSLDRDSLLVKDGPLTRLDLQLLGMITHARKLLADAGIATQPKVFLYGFSASACFANRFATLHPESVRAVVAGGINALPMLPVEAYEGTRLPFPLDVADLKVLTGAEFQAEAYRQVAQYLYMGYLDRNDTFPFGDAWDDDERALIAKVFGQEMMPDRWDRAQQMMAGLKIPVQTATYNGVAHATLPEMWDDVAAFFQANGSEPPEFTKIVPHQYPFVAYRPITEAHVTGIYWKGDPELPPRFTRFPEGGTFVIAIREWMTGQDYQQLRTFIEKAGFEFDLVAEGHAPVHFDRKASCGNVSAGDGSFQGFHVCLEEPAAAQIAPGVAYQLRPKRNNDEFFWSVLPGVVLKK